MATLARRQVAANVGEQLSKKQGGDPFYGPKKKLKPVPPGLSEPEAKIFLKVRRRAIRLDRCFRIPGICRFGWGSVIGLIPVVGDVLDLLMSWSLINTCCSLDPELSLGVKSKMYRNVALDFLVGLVPLLGDIADAFYKCNTRNFILLEKELLRRVEERRLEVSQQRRGPY